MSTALEDLVPAAPGGFAPAHPAKLYAATPGNPMTLDEQTFARALPEDLRGFVNVKVGFGELVRHVDYLSEHLAVEMKVARTDVGVYQATRDAAFQLLVARQLWGGDMRTMLVVLVVPAGVNPNPPPRLMMDCAAVGVRMQLVRTPTEAARAVAELEHLLRNPQASEDITLDDDPDMP